MNDLYQFVRKIRVVTEKNDFHFFVTNIYLYQMNSAKKFERLYFKKKKRKEKLKHRTKSIKRAIFQGFCKDRPKSVIKKVITSSKLNI